jgi:hypothetical protein
MYFGGEICGSLDSAHYAFIPDIANSYTEELNSANQPVHFRSQLTGRLIMVSTL